MTAIEKIAQVAQEVLGKDIIAYNANADLRSLGMNSVSFIHLVVGLEKKYGIEFEDEYLDYEKYYSLADFCDYVNGLINAK